MQPNHRRVNGLEDVLKKTPNGVLLVCGTVVVLAVIASLTFLAWGGKDAAEIRSLINTVMNLASLILGGGAFVYSGMAAKRSDEAAENTNGKMDQKIEAAVTRALTKSNGGETNRGRPYV